MLTLQNLKDLAPDSIFATGICFDNADGVNMANSGKKLRWVAVRGGIWDWAIYVHWEENSPEWVRCNGDKISSEKNIRALVPCDQEAFEMYRY